MLPCKIVKCMHACTITCCHKERHSVFFRFSRMWNKVSIKSDDFEIGPFPFRNWFYQGSNFLHDCFSITTQNNICTPIQFRQKLLRWAFAIRNLKSFSEAKRKSLAPFFLLEARYHEILSQHSFWKPWSQSILLTISLCWREHKRTTALLFPLAYPLKAWKSQRCLALLKDHIVSTGRLGDTKGTTKYYLAASTMKMSIFYMKWWLINKTDNASA